MTWELVGGLNKKAWYKTPRCTKPVAEMELILTRSLQQNNEYRKQWTDDFCIILCIHNRVSLHSSCEKAKNVSLQI